MQMPMLLPPVTSEAGLLRPVAEPGQARKLQAQQQQHRRQQALQRGELTSGQQHQNLQVKQPQDQQQQTNPQQQQQLAFSPLQLAQLVQACADVSFCSPALLAHVSTQLQRLPHPPPTPPSLSPPPSPPPPPALLDCANSLRVSAAFAQLGYVDPRLQVSLA